MKLTEEQKLKLYLGVYNAIGEVVHPEPLSFVVLDRIAAGDIDCPEAKMLDKMHELACHVVTTISEEVECITI